MSGRYLLLGLALPRARWFADVSRWATSAAIPAEFVKCVSAAELRGQLDAGRPFSAVLVDAALPAVDRDLLAAVRDVGCPVLVIAGEAAGRDWRDLGATALLPPELTREALLEALADHAQTVHEVAHDARIAEPDAVPLAVRGLAVAMVGSGGTGTSTLAMATAQGLAADAKRRYGRVLLADLCRRADLAMLHDAREVFPGVQELLEAHRTRRPAAQRVREMAFAVPERGYDLLLGLRRPDHWPVVQPKALTEALRSLRALWGTVVIDCEADLDGEAETGSVDVEDRHRLARTALLDADVVLAVGTPGLKGLHSLTHLLADLGRLGVAPRRIVPVINHAPRSPKARAEIAAALGRLVSASVADVSGPVFVPQRRIEDALRDGAKLPGQLGAVLAGAVEAARSRPVTLPAPPSAAAVPPPVREVSV